MERSFGAEYESLARGGEGAAAENLGRRLVEAKEARPPESAEVLRREMSDGLSPGGPSDNATDNTNSVKPEELKNFRYSDSSLQGGEVRTSAEKLGRHHLIIAELHRRDGTIEPLGTVRMQFDGIRDGGDRSALLAGDSLRVSNDRAMDALLSEAGEQARTMGADHLQVWVNDNNPDAAKLWKAHQFQPLERNPGAVGQHWGKPI